MGLIYSEETPKPDTDLLLPGHVPCPHCYHRYFVHNCEICEGERSIDWAVLVRKAKRIKELCGEKRYQEAVEQTQSNEESNASKVSDL